MKQKWIFSPGRHPQSRAFTLIELLIVVAIIAILAAIAVPNFLEAQTSSKVARCKGDLRNVSIALESYIVDQNKLPPAVIRWMSFKDNMWGYNNYLMATLPGGVGQYCNYLTTPVAYVTSMPLEPFTNGRLGQGQYPMYSYAYTNFEGMSRDPWAKTFKYPTGPGYGDTPQLHLDCGSATVNPSRYLLTAQGPDGQSYWAGISYAQCTGLMGLVENRPFQYGSATVSFQVYDPSNGTVSTGDIFRTQ